jgi:glycosyltransferase involved in cell wall biosynthesis
MLTDPRVTVLIDTYNYGQFIEQAVESVLSQDFPLHTVQILVVDDGSTDDTRSRLERFATKIQYLYKTNGGQATALNHGLAHAEGAIVALLDADDYWLPSKLRRVVQEFDEHPEIGMIYHRLLELNTETGDAKKSLFVAHCGYLPEKPAEFTRYFPYPTSCVAFRRSILQQVLPIPEKLRVQADGYLGATMVFAAPILGIDECLGIYRIHGKNLYHGADENLSPSRRQERIDNRQVIIDGARQWLTPRANLLNRNEILNFLHRWELYQDNDRFALEAPGRLRFFRHLMLYNRCYGSRIGRRLRLVNCINAFASLVTGYKYFYLLDKWRLGLTTMIQRILRR